MKSRTAGLVLVVAGLALAGTTLAQHLVPAAPAVQRVVADFEPVLTEAGVAQLRADLDVVRQGADGLTSQALPALAAAQGVTPQALSSSIATTWPDVATGLAELPGTVTAFSGFADLLDAQRGNFASVASLPVDGVEPTTMPPALLGVGALLVLLGAGCLLRPRSRTSPALAVGLGVVVLAATFGASLPGKASDADAMAVAMRPVMTRAQVDASRASLDTLTAMSTQLQQQMLPATAEALGVTPEQVAQQLGTASPALGQLLVQLPAVQARFSGLVGLLDAHLADWTVATQPSLPLLVRLLIGCALAAVAAGAGALWPTRRMQVVDLRDRTLPHGVVPAPRSAAADVADPATSL